MIGKLRGRSAAELRDRLVQFGWTLTERAGLMSKVSITASHALLPITPWPAVDACAIRAGLSDDEKLVLLARADRIVSGTFDVLGLEGLSYGSPVDWQRDPIADKSAPRVHWSRVPYLDPDVVGDHKVTWEVNRHQWFVSLAQAWQLTKDARYPACAARLLQEWLAANPPKIGINWCSALELAFRAQSWIHGLRLMGGSPDLPLELVRALVSSAAMHAQHIERNLSTWFSPNTHLTGEALALLSIGSAWPDLPGAIRWRRLGWNILCEQLPRQVREDGVYFEQSAWYQAYTVDFYVLAIAWARMANFDVPEFVLLRVQSAARALRAIAHPDGTIVRLGDDDGGHTLRLTGRPPDDVTDTLWRAATLFDDDALIPPVVGGVAALLWLEGAPVHDRMSRRRPGAMPGYVALRQGGWFVLTEPGRTPSEDHWLVFDAGTHGVPPHAHSHADALTLDLSVHGVPLLIDPGTGAYVGEWRTRFRSTRAHNTVTVDDRDSSEQLTSFKWKSAASTFVEGSAATRGAAWVSAFHDGYERLADPVRHHRTILRFDRLYWLMFDTISADGPHEITLTFQCASDAIATRHGAHVFELRARGVSMWLALDPLLMATVEVRTVSPAYASEIAAPAVTAAARTTGTTTHCSVFGAEDEIGQLEVTRIGDASTWLVTHAHGRDVVAHPMGRDVTVGPATFDGTALAVLGADVPHTVVAAGAGTLQLAPFRITLGSDDVCVARRAMDGTWTMEP